MTFTLARRLLTEPDPRLLWKFVWNFGWKGMRAVQRFKKRMAHGHRFPAFLFISLTNDCNLNCRGCWVTQTDPPLALDREVLERVIAAGVEQGSSFFGLLGGEPLLYPELFDVLAAHPKCYFQLFTNGCLVTDEVAARLRELGNVTPLISIEGLERESDERRGGRDVYGRAMAGLERCTRQRLVTGVATSVCRTNFREVVCENFVQDVANRGAHYVWYYIFRPVGGDPAPDLCLSEDQILELRRFLVDIRTSAPIIVVDAYWDHRGRALCPAAVGISHHIGPSGDIEPCPPIQFARDTVQEGGRSIEEVFEQSTFLAEFRRMAADTTRGCLLLENPDKLREFMLAQQARDTSGRQTGLCELQRMVRQPGHHQPGNEIPERSWFYRTAKKYWFFGFGAYG